MCTLSPPHSEQLEVSSHEKTLHMSCSSSLECKNRNFDQILKSWSAYTNPIYWSGPGFACESGPIPYFSMPGVRFIGILAYRHAVQNLGSHTRPFTDFGQIWRARMNLWFALPCHISAWWYILSSLRTKKTANLTIVWILGAAVPIAPYGLRGSKVPWFICWFRCYRINQHTTFEVPSFTDCKDKDKIWSCDPDQAHWRGSLSSQGWHDIF